jgi:hypothetical protein
MALSGLSSFHGNLMSQHILQQFDEQILSDIEQGGDRQLHDRDLLWKPASTQSEVSARQWLSLRPPRQLLVLVVALVIAALALLLAQDAQHRADELQRRLTALERTGHR